MIDATLRVIARAVACAPRRALPWIGALLGWVAGSVLRIRRSLVEAAMERAHVVDPRQVAARMYRELGTGISELLWCAGASTAARRGVVRATSIDPSALEALDTAIARGPVVLLASHTGNWELAAAAAARWLDARGRALSVVAKPMSARGVETFVARLRASFGLRILSPRGVFASAQRALVAGDVVVLPIDQAPGLGSHGIALPFLGAPALVDRAPATLAFRARATVLVVAAERVEGRHHVRVLDVIEPATDGESPRAWVASTTARATSALEGFVRMAPHAWMWLHRRWRPPAIRGRNAPDLLKPPDLAGGGERGPSRAAQPRERP